MWIQVLAGSIIDTAIALEMVWIVSSEIRGEAHSLEGGIVSPFRDFCVCQGTEDFLWNGIATSKIIDFHRTVVDGDSEKQNFKIFRFSISVHAMSLQVDAAVGLEVDAEFLDIHVLFLR